MKAGIPSVTTTNSYEAFPLRHTKLDLTDRITHWQIERDKTDTCKERKTEREREIHRDKGVTEMFY